jgi:SAM-dependent MidA family methyltransferase
VTALSISFEENYCSEINMQLKPWLASLSDSLTEGAVLLIDYGFPQHEYYLPERDTGTLMCHYRHRAHTDPLILTGLQDITAHVDFTAVAKFAAAAGFTVAGYTTQMHFLTNCGLLNMAEEAMKKTHTASEQYAISQAIKKLLLPSEMGELFKAMLLVKQKPNVSVEYSPVLASPHMLVQNEKQCLYKNPLGFSQYDLTHKL